jgi:hypothetical protein
MCNGLLVAYWENAVETSEAEPTGGVESGAMIDGSPADAPAQPSRWRMVAEIVTSIPDLAFIVFVIGAFLWLTIIEPLRFAVGLWRSANVGGAVTVMAVVIGIYALAVRDIRRRRLNWASAILLGILVLCAIALFIADLMS